MRAPPHLSPFTGHPAGGRAAAQAAANPDGGLGVAGAVRRGEGLGLVAALTQHDAMLEPQPAFRSALEEGGEGGGRYHCYTSAT